MDSAQPSAPPDRAAHTAAVARWLHLLGLALVVAAPLLCASIAAGVAASDATYAWAARAPSEIWRADVCRGQGPAEIAALLAGAGVAGLLVAGWNRLTFAA